MSVNSILTNSSALSALQSLNMTESNLAITQDQVSTGLAVANASQNAAYWSIGQQLSSDSGIVTATNAALAQSQAVFDTATSAIDSVITTINSIQTALSEATNPGADFTTINTSLASLSKQLTDAVAGASFNGTNVLNGSQSNTVPLNFVSGFDASATGGTISTIAFQAQALTGAGGGGVKTTTQAPSIDFSNLSSTNAANIASLAALAATGDTTAAGVTAGGTVADFGAVYGANSIATGIAGTNAATETLADTTGDSFAVNSVAIDGTLTTTTYTGIDANGNATTISNAASLVLAAKTAGTPTNAGFAVSVTTTPPAATSMGLLIQPNLDLTTLGTTTQVSTSIQASTMLTSVGAALQAVTSYAATIGATQDRMTAASTLNSALTTNYANGVSALVDADMNTASTRLQALQTQQQLGIQSLSIANQNSQLILKLFNG